LKKVEQNLVFKKSTFEKSTFEKSRAKSSFKNLLLKNLLLKKVEQTRFAQLFLKVVLAQPFSKVEKFIQEV